MSAYDQIARIYDPWSVSVTEDVGFYVDLAKEAGSVVELGVGTGRIAVPTAAAGVPVIGVDSSRGMLEVCAEAAAAAGVAKLVDLRLGDLADPPVPERVPLVTCPFRAYLHLHTDEERLAALAAAHRLLVPGGTLRVRRLRARRRTTWPRRTAAGWSASRGSSSAPSGTPSADA